MHRARAGIVAGAQVSLIASGLCGCENEEMAETVEVEHVIETVSEAKSEELAIKLRLLDLDFAMNYGKMSKKKKKSCGGDCGCEGCKK